MPHSTIASGATPPLPLRTSFPVSPTKRIFSPRGHSRSKSASAVMPPPSPTLLRRRSREYTPPLLRSTSLPLVIPEGQPSPAMIRTPATPTTPHRADSPTRIYASSLSSGATRSGYHPSSGFSPRAPSPPSYLLNEMYPSSSGSSGPSTPTSLRSRSPSISSLETIPDTPDAEEEEEARWKENEGTRRPVVVEVKARGVGGDKRKRWSICGGEKRADLDLETIWEEALTGRGQEDDDEDEDEDED